MLRRIVAGIVGGLALAASFFASIYAIEALKDFRTTDIVAAPWWMIAAELTMCSMALGTLAIGFRFLGFAITGRDNVRNGLWLRPILLGIGLFFPVFLVSLVLGFYWAYHVHSHANPDDKVLVAFKISCSSGVAAAIIGSAILFRRARTRR
jgi:hypothetical protein